jgi:DNA-directed RNA polymerase alpha subunit
LDSAELNREIVESRLDDVHVNLEAITNIRIKALQALQIAQNLLHESAGLFEDPSQSQDLSGDLESED